MSNIDQLFFFEVALFKLLSIQRLKISNVLVFTTFCSLGLSFIRAISITAAPLFLNPMFLSHLVLKPFLRYHIVVSSVPCSRISQTVNCLVPKILQSHSDLFFFLRNTLAVNMKCKRTANEIQMFPTLKWYELLPSFSNSACFSVSVS